MRKRCSVGRKKLSRESAGNRSGCYLSYRKQPRLKNLVLHRRLWEFLRTCLNLSRSILSHSCRSLDLASIRDGFRWDCIKIPGEIGSCCPVSEPAVCLSRGAASERRFPQDAPGRTLDRGGLRERLVRSYQRRPDSLPACRALLSHFASQLLSYQFQLSASLT